MGGLAYAPPALELVLRKILAGNASPAAVRVASGHACAPQAQSITRWLLPAVGVRIPRALGAPTVQSKGR